jgi:uncharacterized protein YbjT (DUF2867 family)
MPGTAAVTGATGFVGRAVVRELLDRGWRDRALARSGEKARRVLMIRETARRLRRSNSCSSSRVYT